MKEIRYVMTEAMLAEIRRQTDGDLVPGGLVAGANRSRRVDFDKVFDAMMDALAAELPETTKLVDQIKTGAFSGSKNG